MALAYNCYALDGVAKRTAKICNAHWNQVAPLVSKWCNFVGEVYRTNPNGVNEDTIIQLADELCELKGRKRFDLMYWWLLLKDIPNGRPYAKNLKK